MAAKGSSYTPPRVILTPNEYKKYIHLTPIAKSTSISSVAQIDNASNCFSHSSGPWILNFGASNHINGNKDIFSSLTITSHLPITLANGSQTHRIKYMSNRLVALELSTYITYLT